MIDVGAHPLQARPSIIRTDGAAAVDPLARTQPRQGLVGLFIVALLIVVLLVGCGGPTTTLHVLGVVSVYALPGAVLVALWWEDWPGSHFRPRWSGLTDILLVAAVGVGAALTGQVVIQHRLDVAVLLSGAPAGPGEVPAFPALIPLGAAVFTVMLQITLVTEGWPFRGLGRFAGGAYAYIASWVIGIGIDLALTGSGLLDGAVLAATLSCVAAFQVLGWVVLRGRATAGISSRPLRLAVGNSVVLGAAAVLYGLLSVLVGAGVSAGAAAAGVVGAGLVTGMLFQGWPSRSLESRAGRIGLVIATIALAGIGLGASGLLASALGLPVADRAGWSTYALNTVATAVIVHVGICRRWPMRERTE